jgi:hypothetical protein
VAHLSSVSFLFFFLGVSSAGKKNQKKKKKNFSISYHLHSTGRVLGPPGTDVFVVPFAYAFSKAETQKLFSRFRDVRHAVAHFPLRRYSTKIPWAMERFLARRMGWYLFVFATR